MNISEKELRKMIVKVLVKSGLKVKDAELEVASLDNSELIFKASELGLNNTEDALVLETVVAEIPLETVSDTINKPKLITVIGKFNKLRIFDKKDEKGEVLLNDSGDIMQTGVIDLEPIFEEDLNVFIQPNQITGFDFNQGNFLKLVVEVRRAHITQYENKKHEIVFHGKATDPKGKIEYGFVTGMEISERKAMIQAVDQSPVELQSSRRATLSAFIGING